MFISDHARLTPDKPAIIMAGSGEVLSYAELNDRSNQFAQFLYAQGLRRGDHIAILMENNIRFMELCFAALRSGIYFTAINRYLPADEVAYIVEDCGAKVIVTSLAKADVAAPLAALTPFCPVRLMIDGVIEGWESYEATIAAWAAEPLAEEHLGEAMLYSSGTTGRPKGVLKPLRPLTPQAGGKLRIEMLAPYKVSPDMVYLSPAPLYHAAPNIFVISTLCIGGTAVIMERFDPLNALALIEKYRVTHSQWVPTMFIRILKIPEAERRQFDLSSQRVVIHAAAPCPIDVKRSMIEWWGPIIFEYYGGTEGCGSTFINSEDWLAHPGSVGPATIGILHICDEEGRELPPGEAGTVYFEREDISFVYHNDISKTRAAQHLDHPTWSTLGDIGYLDEDGYLYLTDRKAFMIISGGVNIYPQGIEDVLIGHPAVGDVAVVGVPDSEMGEAVKAVIEVTPGVAPSRALADELIAFTRARIAPYAVPRSIDFIEEIPRLATGKLYKRGLRDEYAADGRLSKAIQVD